jgi:ATP-dependent DNA helicase PIF1
MLFNIDGTAGCGKTYLIAAICQGLRNLASMHHQPDLIRVFALSGVAALNIHGRTLHSGFSLPLNGFAPLTGSRLANLQLIWEGVYFIIIDEKSMLGLRTLAKIDSRCRQLFPQNVNKPFGNVSVALVGDFAQLPPVGDTPLDSPPSSIASNNGCLSRDGSALY